MNSQRRRLSSGASGTKSSNPGVQNVLWQSTASRQSRTESSDAGRNACFDAQASASAARSSYGTRRTSPPRFSHPGARVASGSPLSGPPETGKPLVARPLSHESGAQFYSQSASAFVEMFAGLGAARIRKLFATARRNAPAIVFIDELDAVGAARTGHGFNREQDQTLNQLLVELDGFDSGEKVVVMGASNRIQDLDQALLRPGRFDRQLLVAPPDLAGREKILQVHTRGKPLAEDVDLHSVARQTASLAGADLADICNEAAIFTGP